MDNVIMFPTNKSSVPVHTVAQEMMKALAQSAYKYGYNLYKDPDAMLDLELIYKMAVSTLARTKNIPHPMQPIMDSLTGADQDPE